jgi:hypothetical protein
MSQNDPLISKLLKQKSMDQESDDDWQIEFAMDLEFPHAPEPENS